MFGLCIFIGTSIFHFSTVNHHLFNSSEPMDENCYEQMKARPERSANELQKATAPAQVSFVFCIIDQAQPRSQHSYMFQEHKSSTCWFTPEAAWDFTGWINVKFWDLSSKGNLKGKANSAQNHTWKVRIVYHYKGNRLKGKVVLFLVNEAFSFRLKKNYVHHKDKYKSWHIYNAQKTQMSGIYGGKGRRGGDREREAGGRREREREGALLKR